MTFVVDGPTVYGAPPLVYPKDAEVVSTARFTLESALTTSANTCMTTVPLALL